ncbi:MAG: hypothetical protein WED09_07215 [Homoserinimonas sp.]
MEKFHHTLPDGHPIELPKFENMPLGLVRKTRRMQPADQVFTMLEELLSETDLEHLDKLDKSQFNELTEAWQAGSAVTLGESPASTSS